MLRKENNVSGFRTVFVQFAIYATNRIVLKDRVYMRVHKNLII